VARALVELHGGEIWVESDLGRGTDVLVSLPLAAGGS
jgi:signal transduction histidine kinase